jgi:hypothetical protein
MGAGSSSNINVDNDILNENITKILNENYNSIGIGTTTIQEMNVEGGKYYCQANFTQKATTGIRAIQQIDSKVHGKIVQQIITSLENDFKNSSKAKSGWGAFPAVSVSTIKLKNVIRNRLSSDTFVKNINDFIAKILIGQKITFKDVTVDPCGVTYLAEGADAKGREELRKCAKDTKCNFGQDAQIEIVVQNIIKNAIEIATEEYNNSDLKNKLDQSSEAEAVGFFQGIGEMFGQLKWIILFVVLAIVAAIIGSVILGKTPAGQKAISKGVNAAANAASAASVAKFAV